MNTLKSFTYGLGRVIRSPWLILWIYLTSMILAVPLSLAMRGILSESIGGSLVHENLRQGFDLGWYGEFSNRSGLAGTFGPSVVGILPIVGNLEQLFDGKILQMGWTIRLAGVLFLLAWAFFAGGILDRYARIDEAYSRSRFLSQSGQYFLRFARLLIVSAVAYWAMFRWIVNPLHNWLQDFTRDVTVERTVMIYTMLVYALAALLLMVISMVIDYAKIVMVVEERRSVTVAVLRGLLFIGAHPIKTIGLYLLLTVVGVGLLTVYWQVAPGARDASWTAVGLAFLIGQAYLLARLILKLWFLASQTVLFQETVPAAQTMTTPMPAPPPMPKPGA